MLTARDRVIRLPFADPSTKIMNELADTFLRHLCAEGKFSTFSLIFRRMPALTLYNRLKTPNTSHLENNKKLSCNCRKMIEDLAEKGHSARTVLHNGAYHIVEDRQALAG